MNEHRDDIRAYPLPQRGLRWVLGPSQLPAGITFGAISATWQADTPLSDDDDDDE